MNVEANVRMDLCTLLNVPDGPEMQEIQAKFDEARRRMWAEHASLVEALDSKRITPEAYFDRFVETMRNSMAGLKTIMGDDRFYKVFGEAGEHPEGMIDRKTFLDQF